MKPPDPVVHARCGGCRRLITDKGPRAKSCTKCDKRRKNTKARARTARRPYGATNSASAPQCAYCPRRHIARRARIVAWALPAPALVLRHPAKPITDPPNDAALLRMQIGTVLEPVVVDNCQHLRRHAL